MSHIDKPPDIRLAYNATDEGRLEMWHNDKWIAVCYDGGEDDDHFWNDQAASVACRQLGYDGGNATDYENLSVDGTWKVNDVRCGNGIVLFQNITL